ITAPPASGLAGSDGWRPQGAQRASPERQPQPWPSVRDGPYPKLPQAELAGFGSRSTTRTSWSCMRSCRWRAGGGQAENGQEPGGGDPPAPAGPDDGAGELPGARELVGPGPAEPQGAAPAPGTPRHCRKDVSWRG